MMGVAGILVSPPISFDCPQDGPIPSEEAKIGMLFRCFKGGSVSLPFAIQQAHTNGGWIAAQPVEDDFINPVYS